MIAIKTSVSGKMQWRNYRAKRLMCILLVAAVLRCQNKQPLPQPKFPLSEEALAAALEETDLSWSIEQAAEHTDGKESAQ